jgi:hypothetical protein
MIRFRCESCPRRVQLKPRELARVSTLLPAPDYCPWCGRALTERAARVEEEVARPGQTVLVQRR